MRMRDKNLPGRACATRITVRSPQLISHSVLARTLAIRVVCADDVAMSGVGCGRRLRGCSPVWNPWLPVLVFLGNVCKRECAHRLREYVVATTARRCVAGRNQICVRQFSGSARLAPSQWVCNAAREELPDGGCCALCVSCVVLLNRVPTTTTTAATADTRARKHAASRLIMRCFVG